jgi:hypothetical protein
LPESNQVGNLWIVDFLGAGAGYSVTQLLPQVLSGSAGMYSADVVSTQAHLSFASAVAIDPGGLVWVSGSGLVGPVTKIDAYNASKSGPDGGFQDTTLFSPAGIAFDSNGNAWVVGQGGDELSGFTNAGVPLPTTPVYGALKHPVGVAVDSVGTIWVTNGTATGNISKFAPGTGVPLEAFIGNLNAPVQLAVDASGNLWTANSGDNSVTVFIGLGAPTTTPLVGRTTDPRFH